jgi:hypothetical protein
MRYALSSFVTLALFATSGIEAGAANRYGVVCLHNETKAMVSLRVKWDDVGNWQEYTLRPGWNRSFSHRYDKQNENKSPKLVVKFDSDVRSGKRYNMEYQLPRRAAAGNSCAEGNQYYFVYEGSNRNFIDLKKR